MDQMNISHEICQEMLQDLIDEAVNFGMYLAGDTSQGKTEDMLSLDLDIAASKVYNLLKVLAENQNGKTNHG